MSTKKFLAKRVLISWQDNQQWKGPRLWYEAQDGRRFERLFFNPSEYLDVKVYLIKKLNVVRADIWAYEMFEVPRKEFIDPKWKDNFRWVNSGWLLFEVKKYNFRK